MFKIKGKKRGFTLIELIVVIAVLGILVTIGVPRYLGYTKDAKVATMQADTKIVEQAAYQYALNNDDAWPIGEEYQVTWEDQINTEFSLDGNAYEIDYDKIKGSIRSLSNKPEAFFIIIDGENEGYVMTKELFEDSAGNLHSGLEVIVKVQTGETPVGD